MIALAAGARWVFVGGKGGVGKTTVASALAVRLADAGTPTLALSVDPAHSLADALGTPLGPEPRPVPGVPRLRAMELDAEHERVRWMARYRPTLAALLERGTYLAERDVAALLELAPPGADELAAMLRLMARAREDATERCVIDTAPTGHTLRLLDTPRLIESWLDALEALDRRHQVVRQAFAPAAAAPPPADQAARELAALRADARELGARLRDPAHTRVVLVTTAEPVVVAETHRYAAALAELGVALGGVVVNRAEGRVPVELPPAPLRLALPRQPFDPRGAERLRETAAAAWSGDGSRAPSAKSRAPAAGSDPRAGSRIHVGGPCAVPAGRRLYVVGGKGGVGKSTVASALAARLATEASHGERVLLLSADPAGSLSELWELRVGDQPVPAPGLPALALRQVDAAAAWARFRDDYRGGTEQLLSELAGDDPDRRFARDVVELTPPGVDELMGLGELVELAELRAYTAIVLDTAPTGHLLRLLAAPQLALEWAHAAMRLLLRYREVVGLGELAERLLRFTRGVHTLQALLQDPARRHMTVVALPETLSIPETRRLLARLRALSLAPELLVVNRLLADDGARVSPAAQPDLAAALLALEGAPAAAAAPAMRTGPRGAAALLAFGRAWRQITLAPPAHAAHAPTSSTAP